MGDLFKLRGELSARSNTILGFVGIALIIFVWYLLTMGSDPVIDPGILPKPNDVRTSYKELFLKNALLKGLCLSLGYNFAGYFVAILVSIPIGFAIGLIPFFRGAFQKPVDAMRYVPLPAAMGLFIVWFGIGTELKVYFLAFGILIYLIPVVVQRIDEVKSVYLKTVYTLGATDWQTVKSVYFPSVISRLSDDIRVLTAISWTYIIIAETIGTGGLGKMIWSIGQRRGRVDVVFALLILIVVIGILQDRLFVDLDKKFFPHKFQEKKKAAHTIWTDIKSYSIEVLVLIGVLGYSVLLYQHMTMANGTESILTYLFEDTLWVIHLIFLMVIAYKANGIYKRFILKPKVVKTA